MATTELVLQLDSSWRLDSNPRRIAQTAGTETASGILPLDDSIIASDLRLALVYPLDSPDTRLVMIGQLGERRYNQLSDLDNTTYAYKATLVWRLNELLHGEMFQSRARQPYDFIDGNLTARDMTRQTDNSAMLALQISPSIEMPVILKTRRLTYDTITNSLFNSDERSLAVGVQMGTGTGSNAGFGLRTSDVSFTQRSDEQAASLGRRYRDLEIYAGTSWQYSALTRLDVRVAPLQRAYTDLAVKNFTALVSEMQVRHLYSPKTTISAELTRRPTDATDSAALYSVVTRAQLGLQWRASPKTQFVLQMSQERQTYQSALLNTEPFNPELRRVRIGGGLIYAASRDIRLYLDGFRDRADRGSLGPVICQNTMRAGLEYTFESLPGLAQRTGLGERR